MDLCDFNLTDLIKQRKEGKKYFKMSEVQLFLTNLVPALAKMQQRRYLHRDIKPDNILVIRRKESFTFKIGDFGFGIKENCYSSKNIAGTKEYVSPKLMPKFINNKKTVPGSTVKDDVYSFGKTFSEMMTLEIGQDFDLRVYRQCEERFGKEMVYLLKLMMEEN